MLQRTTLPASAFDVHDHNGSLTHYITEAEITALLQVLTMFERDEFTKLGAGEWKSFNIIHVLEKGTCGTVGCFAGWANHLSIGNAFPELSSGDPLPVDKTRRWARLHARLPQVFRNLFTSVGPDGGGTYWTLEDFRDRLSSVLTTGKLPV